MVLGVRLQGVVLEVRLQGRAAGRGYVTLGGRTDGATALLRAARLGYRDVYELLESAQRVDGAGQ